MKQNKRNKKIDCFFSSLFLLLLFFLSTLQTFAQEQCSGVTDADGKCYDSYDAYFQEDPKAAALQYPDKYMEFIKQNPDAVTSNPDAYEAVISGNVAYLNENKDAFQKFAAIKGVELKLVQATFGSYDAATGRMETVSTDGTTVTSVDFDGLKELDGMGDIYFDNDGMLRYQRDVSTETGMLRESTRINGEIQKNDGTGVVIKDGKVILDNSRQTILIAGENSAVLRYESGLSVYAVEPVSVEYEVIMKGGKYSRVSGVLVSGTITLRDTEPSLSLILRAGSEFITVYETNIKTGEDSIQFFATKEECKVHCFVETEDSLYINPSEFKGRVEITTPDNREKKIAIGKFPSLADSASTLVLTLAKKDGSTVIFGFSKDPPTLQGDINGLQTKMAHTFTFEGQTYPWLLSHGKTITTIGTTNTNLFVELINEKKIKQDEIFTLMEVMQSDEFRGMIHALDDPDLQYHLLETYRATKDLSSTMTEDEIFIVSGIQDEETRERVIIRLLKNTDSFEDIVAITTALSEFDESPEVLTSIIDLVIEGDFYDTDHLLLRVESPELQRRIIKGAKSFDSSSNIDRITDKETRLEMIRKMDFTSGDFAKERNLKGVAFRKVLQSFSDDPEALAEVLRMMPVREDMDFYPENIADIYENPTFEEQTKDLDFANKYSVAITADRLQRRTGEPLSATTMTEATTTIMEERSNFEEYRILVL